MCEAVFCFTYFTIVYLHLFVIIIFSAVIPLMYIIMGVHKRVCITVLVVVM